MMVQMTAGVLTGVVHPACESSTSDTGDGLLRNLLELEVNELESYLRGLSRFLTDNARALDVETIERERLRR